MVILQIQETCGFLKGALATTQNEDNTSRNANLEKNMKISFYGITAK
jgi:hypothetical protein